MMDNDDRIQKTMADMMRNAVVVFDDKGVIIRFNDMA